MYIYIYTQYSHTVYTHTYIHTPPKNGFIYTFPFPPKVVSMDKSSLFFTSCPVWGGGEERGSAEIHPAAHKTVQPGHSSPCYFKYIHNIYK